MNLNETLPALKYGAKILPHEVLNMGAELGRGRTFYVMDSTATGFGDFSKDHGPITGGLTVVVNDIDAGINKCTAAFGDMVLVTPGFTETIAAAADLDADVQGMSILGLGIGDNRPLITFSATTSDWDLDADDMRISNFVLTSTIDDLANMFDVNNEDCQIDNIKITDGGKKVFGYVDFATTKDRLLLDKFNVIASTDPDTTDGDAGSGFLYLVDSEDVICSNSLLRDVFETAQFHNKTVACKGLWVMDVGMQTTLSTSVPFELVAGAEGAAERCFGSNEPADDVTDAKLYGAIGTKFWISATTSLGNDSGGGGQGSTSGVITT